MPPWDPHERGDYWVVGGKYLDAGFRHRRWSEVIGPVDSLYEATAIWRRMSYLYSHDALVRFHVVRSAESARAA
ncbi:DUF4170 domain-containing protein [Phenylobacterium sp.]|uniref:DUF4170 domain-containing protein n=1 Tax=Phenylobacterium sp. TaxID=1871053 RepID=UPI002FE1948C